MAAYRFCRPDDLRFLVEAVDSCYSVHFPEKTPLTLEGFQLEIRELDVWPSSCVLACAESLPIGVCIASKRADAVLVHRVGVRPGHTGQGHGSHMLQSLARKLAVLGPPRLVTEVPADQPGVQSFFKRLGYREENRYCDFHLDNARESVEFSDSFIPVTLKDLCDNGVLETRSTVSWQRQRETLKKRAGSLEGTAIASPDRIEAFLLSGRSGPNGRREIAAIGMQASEASSLLLSLLLRCHCQGGRVPLSVSRVSENEVPFHVLESLGFRRGRQYLRLVCDATTE